LKEAGDTLLDGFDSARRGGGPQEGLERQYIEQGVTRRPGEQFFLGGSERKREEPCPLQACAAFARCGEHGFKLFS
jgi:hypothetical protein